MSASALKKTAYRILDMASFYKGLPRKINGMTIRFRAGWFRYFESDYEKENCAFLQRMLKPGMDIIDIGAHIGFFSVVFSQLTKKSGRIVCIEPTPGTFQYLLQTLKINHCENVTPVQAAVSDQLGNATFFISEEYEGNNSNSLVDKNPLLDMKGYEVRLETIDNIVKTYSLKPSFIKIDVEGAELDALRGGLSTFAEYKSSLILGLHPAAIKRKGDSLEAIWDLLINAGYRIEVNGEIFTREDFCSRTLLFDVHCIAEQ